MRQMKPICEQKSLGEGEQGIMSSHLITTERVERYIVMRRDLVRVDYNAGGEINNLFLVR